jgi:hypothetical protein
MFPGNGDRQKALLSNSTRNGDRQGSARLFS